MPSNTYLILRSAEGASRRTQIADATVRGHARETSSECQQAAKWPPSFSSKAGISRVQISVAKEQRAANGQPGIASFNDGTVPGISASRGRRESARLAPSFGTEARSPRV